MILKLFKLVLGLLLVWLFYLFYSILSFPVGKLSDSADAAIVLGAAVYDSKPSPVFAARLNHAINLYHKGKVHKLIFTGGTVDKHTQAESIVARDFAISKKVNNDDIYIETNSLTTQENLTNAHEIFKLKKLQSALIVSDNLHLKRAMLMAKDLNINATPSATPTSRYQSLKTRLPFAFRELYFYHHYLLFSK